MPDHMQELGYMAADLPKSANTTDAAKWALSEITRLRDALSFYADSGVYCCPFLTTPGQDDRCPVLRDDGATARAALSTNAQAEGSRNEG